MKRRKALLYFFILLVATPGIARAQAWSGILDPSRAINWSTAGAASIPARTTFCSTLGATGQTPSFVQSVTMAQINSALSACPSGQTVLLNPGTYNTGGASITILSNRTLRGSGPTQTIINESGSGGGGVVRFGGGASPSSGASTAITVDGVHNLKGSTSIIIASSSGITVGTMLMLSQTDLSYMTENSDQGTCSWCNGSVGGDSGQTTVVTSVSGTTIGIRDPLYIDYTNSPQAYRFTAGCSACGLENLKISAENVGYDPNIDMTGVVDSWIMNVESDFADGAHVHLDWSSHNTIRDSFFHDGYAHGPGGEDDQLRLGYKSSANLIENDIFWRQHISIMPEWGASGNVIAYCYSSGNYDDSGTWFIMDMNDHGAHPMMNLFEGDVFDMLRADTTHGSESYTTVFRSYATGSQVVVPPKDARGALQMASAQFEGTSHDCAICEDWGPNSAIPEAGAIYDNIVGTIVGSDHLISSLRASSQLIAPTSTGSACAAFGYDSNAGAPVSPNVQQATMFIHGLYQCTSNTFSWTSSVTQTLPASFYLSGKPSWWGSLPWPPIGPDVTGGTFIDWQNSSTSVLNGHVNTIPAASCFLSSTLNGTSNVTTFNASVCYTTTVTTISPPTNLKATVN